MRAGWSGTDRVARLVQLVVLGPEWLEDERGSLEAERDVEVGRDESGHGSRVLVVLRGAFDRREPALFPLHPDLVLWSQLEGRVIETPDSDLDVRVGVGGVEEPGSTG